MKCPGERFCLARDPRFPMALLAPFVDRFVLFPAALDKESDP